MKKSMARVAAIENGDVTYVPESPCARGHLLRSTSGGSCIECRRLTEKVRYCIDPQKTKARTKKKYQANAGVIRAKRRLAYEKNRDTEKEIARVRSIKWRLNNPQHEGAKNSKRKYAKNNVSKCRALVVKYRASKLNRTPKWLVADDLWMIEQAYELATLRTKLFGFSWHVDHVIPLQGKKVSGLHVPNNLQVIPWMDNVRKSNTFEAGI